MPNFNDITCKQFIEDYKGKELFKEYIPSLGKLPGLAYKPFYSKKAADVVEYVIGKGYCDQAGADALIAKFNELYDK